MAFRTSANFWWLRVTRANDLVRSDIAINDCRGFAGF